MIAMRAEAASQISVSENRGLTSALHPIAAVRVVGFRQAARDPERPFDNDGDQKGSTLRK